mmetsp:Transcript_20171/g.19809  ORF Transcript_20171/g.19809 Transcript_20171/m.19809 type:complete len:176 (+) Transcript_20171:86-613(+)
MNGLGTRLRKTSSKASLNLYSVEREKPGKDGSHILETQSASRMASGLSETISKQKLSDQKLSSKISEKDKKDEDRSQMFSSSQAYNTRMTIHRNTPISHEFPFSPQKYQEGGEGRLTVYNHIKESNLIEKVDISSNRPKIKYSEAYTHKSDDTLDRFEDLPDLDQSLKNFYEADA